MGAAGRDAGRDGGGHLEARLTTKGTKNTKWTRTMQLINNGLDL